MVEIYVVYDKMDIYDNRRGGFEWKKIRKYFPLYKKMALLKK